MKRFLIISLAVLMIAVLFAGCGSQDPKGTYILKTIDGKPLEEVLKENLEEAGWTLEVYMSLNKIESLDDYMVLELKPFGVAVMNLYDRVAEGTWSQTGFKVTIDIDDYPADYNFSGNELTGYLEGHRYVFVRK
jgi:hypothetical protein